MRRRDFLWRFRRIAHDVNAFIGGEVPVREVEADAKRGVAVRCEDQIRGEHEHGSDAERHQRTSSR